MTISFHIRRLAYLGIVFLTVYVAVQLLWTQNGYGYLQDEDRGARLKEINKMIESSKADRMRRGLNPGGQACRHPPLDINNPSIMKHIHSEPPIECAAADWVTMSGGTARITDAARAANGEIECSFTDVIRDSDQGNHDGVTTTTHTEYNLEESDFVKVRCRSAKGTSWSGILAGIRHEQDIRDRASWDKLDPSALKLNVLMFGFDSLSRNMFQRKLPRSYAYLRDVLQGITLEGYNIVGDGTPQALIPILTGKTELELPETRKRKKSMASHVNVYPFVWNDFRQDGYVTAFMEDLPNVGTFTYRLKGFDEPPTDHYMRPFHIAIQPELRSQKKLCMGSIPRHMVMLNYARDFFRTYRDVPKFMFGFHGELSHDSYNLVGVADNDLLLWMMSLREEGLLNNTLFIMMSDHGHRFTNIRETQQGKQEERLPFFTFAFPPSFRDSHPEAIRNFQKNAQRLTTPFDINPTLRNVIRYAGHGKGSTNFRAISLFQEVPLNRTCGDAGIEPHWCACLDWQEVSLSDSIVQRAATSLIDRINRYTSKHRSICSELKVHRVQWAARLLPSAGLMKFHKSSDYDGFRADLSDRTPLAQVIYQIKIAASPGAGLFEASLTYSTTADRFDVKMSEVSRINRYGSQAHCIYEKQQDLRKYCHCIAAPPVGFE